jgi:hypothetical protein
MFQELGLFPSSGEGRENSTLLGPSVTYSSPSYFQLVFCVKDKFSSHTTQWVYVHKAM